MNKQIQSLAEQAGLEFDDDSALESEPIYYITQKDLEKFAELIVRECAIIANRAENTETETRCMYDVIAEHFGVEE